MSLFQVFIVIGTYNMLAFGNGSAVVALLQHRLVEDSGILNLNQFLYAYALGRVTPGQNNLYLASIGFMIYGWLGALAAMLSIQIGGYLVLPVLKVYDRMREVGWVQGAIRGLGASSVGLMFAVGFRVGTEAMTGLIPWVVFLSTLALIFLARRGMLVGMLGATVLGLGLKFILPV